ncbi:WD40 repeat domain-containing protein [Microcoleus sp. ZQ-A2]|nr:WD40 repeat domain-containing protein [Microcoleus sp. FACHB-1]
MSSDNEPRNKGIVPAGNRGLTRYSSRLIQRGLDLAKELDKSEAGLEISRQTSEITTPQKLIWKCIRTLIGHLNVYSVAISPDGQILASCGDDKTIKIWNLNTGELLRTFTGHSDIVWCVTFSPDGQILATCSEDQTVKIWKLDTGELISTLLGHSEAVVSITFSPDGKTLVSGSGDKTVKIWSLSTGTQLYTLTVDYDIANLAIRPNGQTLVTAGVYGRIKLWNLPTGELLSTLPEGHSPATVSPDGQIVACAIGQNSSTIKLWGLESGEFLYHLTPEELKTEVLETEVLETEEELDKFYCSFAIDPKGKNLAGGTADGIIKIFDVDTGKLLCILSGNSRSALCFTTSPDRRNITSGSSVLSVTFSPDGQILVSGSLDGSINIWRVFPLAESEVAAQSN